MNDRDNLEEQIDLLSKEYLKCLQDAQICLKLIIDISYELARLPKKQNND